MTYTMTEIKEISAAIASLVNTPVSTKMSFTIEEHIESKYGNYMTIGIKQCAVCTVPFPDICDEDPGSVEAAVGVTFVCEHPECREIAGGAVLICGTDIQELLEKDHNDIFALAEQNNGVLECDGFDVDLYAIVDRRVTVGDYLQELGWMQEWGGAWDTCPYARDEDDWDSDNEKWSNYWGDYNQCGVHVSY